MAGHGAQNTSGTLRRLGWFAGLWLASVLSLGIVALGIKWMIRATG